MCSIAAAGIGLQAFGMISSFMGQRQQAASAEASAAFNAQVARNNATIARQQAGLVHQQGKVAVAKEGLKARQLAGLQRATLAGNGVLVGFGSAGDIVADTGAAAAVDAATLRSNAARQALGFITQSTNFDASAGLIIAEGGNRASALNAQATSSLLTGAGSVADKWNAYRVDTGEDPFDPFAPEGGFLG